MNQAVLSLSLTEKSGPLLSTFRCCPPPLIRVGSPTYLPLLLLPGSSNIKISPYTHIHTYSRRSIRSRDLSDAERPVAKYLLLQSLASESTFQNTGWLHYHHYQHRHHHWPASPAQHTLCLPSLHILRQQLNLGRADQC